MTAGRNIDNLRERNQINKPDVLTYRSQTSGLAEHANATILGLFAAPVHRRSPPRADTRDLN